MTTPRGLERVAFSDPVTASWRMHFLRTGRRIAAARTRRGWVEQEVANVCLLKGTAVTPERVGEIERGALPTEAEATVLERALGFEPHALVAVVRAVPDAAVNAVAFTTAAAARAKREAEDYTVLANRMMWAASREAAMASGAEPMLTEEGWTDDRSDNTDG